MAEQLLLDSGLPESFFNLLGDLNIGIQELSVITAVELEEALQQTSLGEGYVWNTQQIFDRILKWQQKNQAALQNLVCPTNEAGKELYFEEDTVGETAGSSTIEADQTYLSEEALIVPVNESDGFGNGRENAKISQELCSPDVAGCSNRKIDQVVSSENPASLLNAPKNVALPNVSTSAGQILSNSDSSDCSSHGDGQALVGKDRSSHFSVEQPIIPEQKQHSSQRQTSLLLSNAPGGSVSLKDITNIGQRSSDESAAGSSVRSTGLIVVDENSIGRKLFSPSVLLQLLNSTELGKDIIRRSEIGELSTGRQHELAGIVAEWHLTNRTRLMQEDLEEYAATVTSVFTSEKKVTYYLERGGVKKNPGGIIYNKISNLKAKARKRDKSEADYAKRIRTGADETKTNKTSTLALKWLTLNDGPWATVLEKWKESFDSRNHFIGKSTAEPNLRKHQMWKHIQTEFGYQLIDSDFDLKYPNAKDGTKVWADLLVHITDYFKIHINDEFSIRILHDLTNSDLSEDSRLCAILILLNCVLPPVRVTAGYKPTVASAQEETILFDLTEQGANQKLQELHARYKDLGLPAAPKLIALGANYKELQGHFIVCYGDLSYKLSSMKRAVDVFIKLALVIGLQHSKITKLIWLFIVRCVYGVYVPEKYSSIEKLVIHLNNVRHV